MDPRLELTMLERDAKVTRKRRATPDHVIFYIYLQILRGGNVGGLGLEKISAEFRLSDGTISNYFGHVTFSVIKVLKG